MFHFSIAVNPLTVRILLKHSLFVCCTASTLWTHQYFCPPSSNLIDKTHQQQFSLDIWLPLCWKRMWLFFFSFFVFSINGYRIGFKFRFRWVTAHGVGQIVLSQRNLPFGVPAMTSLTGRGIAVLGVELAQMWSHPSGQGPCQVSAAEKSHVGQWASLDGNPEWEKKTLPEQNEQINEAGWSVLLHLPPLSSHLYLSSPLCKTLCLLLKEEYFSFQFFLIVSFCHQILPYLTSRKERSFLTSFLGATRSREESVSESEKSCLYVFF